MLLQLSRLASFVVAAVALSGCFTSDYDISNRLKPDFPLAAGRYKSKLSKVISIAVSDDAYKAVEPSKDTERKISLRFSVSQNLTSTSCRLGAKQITEKGPRIPTSTQK